MSRFYRYFVSNGFKPHLRAYLGLTGRTVRIPHEAPTAKGEQVATCGVRVKSVKFGSPAEEAGLQEGDVILRLDDRRVTNAKRLRELLTYLPVGLPLTLVLLRGDRMFERLVILEDLNPAKKV